VNTLQEVLSNITGRKAGISVMMGGCDMRYFHAAGIPTVIYGPGTIGIAHQADECVKVKDLVTAAQVYSLTAMRLLGVHS